MKRFIIMLAAVAVLAFSTQAFADSTHECQGNSCNGNGGGTTTNNITNQGGQGGTGIGYGGQGGAGGQGGQGGQGGKGGNATAVSGSISSSKSSSKSESTAVGVGIGGSSSATANGGTVGGEYTGGSYVGGNQDVHIDTPHQAPTVVAPGLTAAGTGVCLGSVSIGLSGPMAGASFGITKVDKGCEARSGSALLMQYSERARLAGKQEAFERASLRVLAGESLKDALTAEGLVPQSTKSAAVAVPQEKVQPIALTVPAAMEQTQTRRIENVQGN